MTHNNHKKIEVQTLQLIPILDQMLIELLRSLKPEEWNCPTVARLWTVKDIASHLLDGNLRNLSASRDRHFTSPPNLISNYQELVTYINDLNAQWVNATKRLSTGVITDLLETTGREYLEHLSSLDPFGEAVYAVAWAGQTTSPNWFHIAREYTEKFIHQQQIREALGRQALFSKDLFAPYLQTSMYALPSTFKRVESRLGTTVVVEITTDIGGVWTVEKAEDEWKLRQGEVNTPTAKLYLTPEIAWKLFSKAVRPNEIIQKVKIEGDRQLGEQALQMVAVMA